MKESATPLELTPPAVDRKMKDPLQETAAEGEKLHPSPGGDG
jgi:hypothetical protein